MKKFLIMMILVSLLFGVAACDKDDSSKDEKTENKTEEKVPETKKLTCTGDMMGMDAVAVTTFNENDESVTVSMTLVMDVKEYFDLEKDPSKDEMKTYEDSIKKQYEEMEGYYDVTVTSKGSEITVKCSYDIASKDATNYEETKEDMESLGLTCK